jgi:multimeric flavodoxin WrbA
MKVLFINGSPDREGNTAVALEEMARVFQEEGIETETVWLGKKPTRTCIACGKCQEMGNNHCVFADDKVNEINDKAREADGFVIGSPVYYGVPAGNVLSAVQRMLYSASENYEYKPVANIAICRRGGATSSIEALNMPWLMVNCPIVPSQYWNIAYGGHPGEAAFDGEGMQTMRTAAHNMAWMMRNLKKEAAPRRAEDWNMTNFVRDDLTQGRVEKTVNVKGSH